MTEKHRVVSVGERRNMNRLLDVVASATDEALPDLTPAERKRLVVAVGRSLHNAGFTLTRQVR